MTMNKDSEISIQWNGNIYIFKNKIFGSKWKEFCAILYSDSNFKWFSKKNEKDPKGSIMLKNFIPYICIGRQIEKLPTKHPKIQETWKGSLIAIAANQEASKIHWLCFETTSNLKSWLQELIETLPKLNPPAYLEKETCEEEFNEELSEPPPYEDENEESEGITKKKEKNPKTFSKTTKRTLDGKLFDYGFGRSFYPLTYFGLDNNLSSHPHYTDDSSPKPTDHSPPIHHHKDDHYHQRGDHNHHHKHDHNPNLQTSNTGPGGSISNDHHHKNHTTASNGTRHMLTHHNHHHGIVTPHNHTIHHHTTHHITHHVAHHHTSHIGHTSHFGGHHGHF